MISRLQREKADQLKSLSSKLLLFESRLIRKQKDISSMLNARENIIHRQQRIIESLTSRLIDNGLEAPAADLTELDSNLLDLDSLNDSDSAVVMEDVDSDCNMTHVPKFRSSNADCITIMRSVSDAIDPNLKYSSCPRRSNGFLRRPEILETVYSVEEDGDNENQNESKTDANKKRDAFANRSEKAICNAEEASVNGQKDRLLEEKTCALPSWPYKHDRDAPNPEAKPEKGHTHQVTTYNRVMSNHRSVTKPKDVKYKRINKAKSKSLEELRGRLKNWVDQGSKFAGLTLEHSQSYA